MSYCRKEGKDVVMFVTEEDHKIPSTVVLPEPEQEPGLILPNGEINWNCPCLGGITTGPCAVEFRGAFSCFHYSEADPKGSDCYDQFQEMQVCMSKYPSLYSKEMDDHTVSDKRPSVDSTEEQAEPKNEVIECKEDPSKTEIK